MSKLELEKLRIEYVRERGPATLAVSDVSLTVDEGEFVSIVGPSGCGKTTLLRVVAGLLAPTSGGMRLDGRPLSEYDGDRAVVFQEASLFPWFTVARNVAYGLECRGVRRREAARMVQPFIELVGLAGFESYYPYQISGGMQQRANLARALAVEPGVLLMDEPFASLDAQTREMMQLELVRIWEETRKTVLFVTHQISEAVYLSDRVVVLSSRPGRVLADIPIDMPRPRGFELKRTDAFMRYEDDIWRLIQAEGRQGMVAAPAGDEVPR